MYRVRDNREWQELVKGVIRAELARRNLSYRLLAERLSAIGVIETERNLSNKISRGKFTTVFFFQVMTAIGVKTVHLNGE